MLISIGLMCLMLCAPLDWQYAELPSSASDAGHLNQIEKQKKKKKFLITISEAMNSKIKTTIFMLRDMFRYMIVTFSSVSYSTVFPLTNAAPKSWSL